MATKPRKTPDTELSFGERLKSAALEAGAKKKTHVYLRDWFLKEHGIAVSTTMISRYGPKKRELPHIQQCRDFAEALGVCVEWLYTGRGSRYPETGVQSEQEGKILALWRKWSPIVKHFAFDQLEYVDGRQERIERQGNPKLTDDDIDTLVTESLSETGEFKSLDPRQ